MNDSSLNFRVPAKQVLQIRREAKHHGITVGALLRKIIEAYFAGDPFPSDSDRRSSQ